MTGTDHGQREQEARAALSRRILAEVERDSETVGGSSFARAAGKLAAPPSIADDPIERWGRRIGRGLGALAALALLAHLVLAYVLR